MSLTISFGSITLASRDRLRLGPPDFPRLKRIHIGELRAYAPDDVPDTAGADMARLRAMNANVEQLEIGVLTILRGGLDIKDVMLIEVRTSLCGWPPRDTHQEADRHPSRPEASQHGVRQ